MPALVPTRQEPTRGFNGCARGLQRYRCRDCSCTFNALTGTPLAQLRHRDRWYEQGRVLIYGLSVTMAAEQLQVARSTAFRWWHCFLQLPQHVKAAKLEGIVEADETGWLKSCKGQRRRRRSQQRLARRRGGRAKTRGLSDEYDVVLVMRDRSGGCADQIARAQGAAHLAAVLQPKLAAEAVLCTDGSMALAAAAMERKLRLSAQQVMGESDLAPALQKLLPDTDLLLALPDAAVFNAGTIQLILLSTYRHQRPLIGFSASYTRAGAILSLFSTPRQIGAQAADMLRAALASGRLPPPQYPREFQVAANPHVARSLGLSLDSEDGLLQRLREMD